MPAEGMPHAPDSLLARPLGFAAGLIARAPRLVLFLAIALAAAALLLTVGKLRLRTSRLDLLNPRSPYNQRWLAYLDEFGDEDDAVIVVSGTSRDQVVPVLDELAAAAGRESGLFTSVLHKTDLIRLRSKQLHFLSEPELHQIEQFVQRCAPVLRGDWSQLGVARLLASINQRLAGAVASDEAGRDDRAARLAVEEELALLARSISGALENPPRLAAPWTDVLPSQALAAPLESRYLLSDDGGLGIVMVRVSSDDDGFVPSTRSIQLLRHLVQDARARHPDMQIGLTGLPVMENDEMQASQSDMIQASLVSLAGVSILFAAGFGGLRHPLSTVATLIIAISWSFGYVTLAIGHLNILSVSFGVILIGLGIDFGVHYVARYLQLRQAGIESRAALVQASSSVGPGIITGGLTTAIAFSTAWLTDFTGVAELGIIAGGGIVLCIVAALLVLPAMIILVDRDRGNANVPAPVPISFLFRPAIAFPRAALVAGVAMSLMVFGGSWYLRMDHNLLNLQPVNLESVALERELLKRFDRSNWYALSMADSAAELRRRKRQFEALPSVERTEEIVSLLPPDAPGKVAVISRLQQSLAGLPAGVPLIPVASLDSLDAELVRSQTLLESAGSGAADLRKQLGKLRRRFSELDSSRPISDFQQQLAAGLYRELAALRSIANPAPPGLEDLPPSLVTRFVGKTNRYLLKVHARGNIWEMDRLQRFVAEVESVDPRVTGHPVQAFYASRQMQQSYVHAAIYAFLAICIVLMVDFRSITHSLLALLPMLLGLGQLLGLLGLFDIPLNPANMLVLPLILGIGIDDGVHLVHDFRRQAGRYRVSSSTAAAILITSATTMMGFGSMMFASHRGLRSLGQVLTIGVACCLVTSIVILPALLAWLSRWRERNAESEQAFAGRSPDETPARPRRAEHRQRRPASPSERVLNQVNS